jgi:hypothetical protein
MPTKKKGYYPARFEQYGGNAYKMYSIEQHEKQCVRDQVRRKKAKLAMNTQIQNYSFLQNQQQQSKVQLQRIKRQVSEPGAAAVCLKETKAAIRTAKRLAEEAVEQADADIKAVENLLLLRQAQQRKREEVEKHRRKLQDLQSLQSALDAVEMEDATSTAEILP